MTHGSLFSGIGGFDLAAQWMGWNNIFHCEWNPFGQKVLKHHFPKSISYNDITKTDFTIHRGTIDILTGGFPCQPYSNAGKRKGKEDERHLWPEMLRAIREIQPRFVVGENVLGLVNWSNGLVFHEVQTDLETAGYEVFPYVLPACAVNAPHRRDRVWFVANSINNRYNTNRGEICKENGIQGISRQTMDTGKLNGTDISSNATDTNSNGLNGSNGEYEVNTSEGRINALGNIEQMGGDVTDTNGIRRGKNEWRNNGESNEFNEDGTTKIISNTKNIGRKDALENRKLERGRLRFGDKPPTWDSFPSQSPICGGDDGLPTKLDGITFPKWRNESIKAFGNAIVPQVAYQIFKAIDQL